MHINICIQIYYILIKIHKSRCIHIQPNCQTVPNCTYKCTPTHTYIGGRIGGVDCQTRTLFRDLNVNSNPGSTTPFLAHPLFLPQPGPAPPHLPPSCPEEQQQVEQRREFEDAFASLEQPPGSALPGTLNPKPEEP